MIAEWRQWNPPTPEVLKLFLESFGSKNHPTTPHTKATADARAKAGMFPFPKSASHGPEPRATITCSNSKYWQVSTIRICPWTSERRPKNKRKIDVFSYYLHSFHEPSTHSITEIKKDIFIMLNKFSWSKLNNSLASSTSHFTSMVKVKCVKDP